MGEREVEKQRTRTALLQSGAREKLMLLTGAFEIGDPLLYLTCSGLTMMDGRLLNRGALQTDHSLDHDEVKHVLRQDRRLQ